MGNARISDNISFSEKSELYDKSINQVLLANLLMILRPSNHRTLAIPAIKQVAMSIKCIWSKPNSSLRKGTLIIIARKTIAPPIIHHTAEARSPSARAMSSPGTTSLPAILYHLHLE
jgi:hypothetical protein